jgi:tryptophan halogenase
MPIPEKLAYKIEQFKQCGRVVEYGGELFAKPSWLAVFMGQDIRPQRYDPLVDQHDIEDLRSNLENMRLAIREAAESAPLHTEYIAQNCRAVS